MKRAVFDHTDSGLRAAERLMQECDPDPRHALHVCKTGLALFGILEELHGLGPAERRLLAAAALMHDTGFSVDINRHHKHSRDVILRSDLEGFTSRERKMIACIARYHRKAHPAPTHSVYGELNKEDQDAVKRLAALLRLADGLDRSHCSSVERVRFEREGTSARLYVRQREPNHEDLWGATRKQGLFEEVFGLGLEVLADGE